HLHTTTRPPPPSPLFPYTTLFRSHERAVVQPAQITVVDQGAQQVVGRAQRQLRLTGQLFRGRAVLVRARRLQQAEGPLHGRDQRSEEHTSELQSRENLVCRLLLEK